MQDSGKVMFCDIVDISAASYMPKEILVPVHTCLFENRIVGYNRRYAALGVNQEISALIRVWRPPLRNDRRPTVEIGMIAVIEESEIDGQYRVDVIQPLRDFDYINISEITLSKLENYYDVAASDDGYAQGDLPVYAGPYAVTPETRKQVLDTNLKTMSDDVTVYEIPYAETTNKHGTTVVIAS